MRWSPQILAAALAATAFTVPAAAQSSVAVRYSDLDLSTSDGQAKLERRINQAARSVCGMDDVASGTRLSSGESQRCFAEAKGRIHAQVAETIERGNGRG